MTSKLSIGSGDEDESSIIVDNEEKRRRSKVELLTEEQIADCQDLFELFDRDQDGLVATKDIRLMLRALAQFPNELELKSIIKAIDPEDIGHIDFEAFLEIVAYHTKETFTEDEIKECFKVFDPQGRGYITEEELSDVLTNLGERFTEDELEQFMREADFHNDGKICYPEFIMFVM